MDKDNLGYTRVDLMDILQWKIEHKYKSERDGIPCKGETDDKLFLSYIRLYAKLAGYLDD